MAERDDEPTGNLGEQSYDMQKLLEAQSRMFGRQEFHEQMSPEEVRVEANVSIDGAIDNYYEDQIAPNSYYFESSLYPQVRRRLERLKIALPEGRVTATPDEKQAGIVAGEYVNHVPMDRVIQLMAEGIVPDPNNSVWKKRSTGETVAGYRDDSDFQRIFRPDDEEERSRPIIPRNVYMVHNIPEDVANEKREKLISEIERQFRQTKAWVKFINAVNYQDMLADDLENYTVRRFTSYGGQWMISRYVSELLNAPESRPELMARGDKLTAGFEAWRDILEGRAVYQIVTPEGETKEFILSNPFAQPKNWRLRQICQSYAISRIQQKDNERRAQYSLPTRDSLSSVLKTIDEEENIHMARAAELLMDHWDFDAAHGIDIYKNSRGEIEVEMEGAYNDAAIKLYNPTVRQASERWGNVKRLSNHSLPPERKYPRESGSPFTLETLPVISSHFLDTTRVSTVAVNKGDLEERNRDPQKFDREGKKVRVKKQSVTIDQIAYGSRNPDGSRKITLNNGNRLSEIRIAKDSSRVTDNDIWVYKVVGLQDKNIWDELQIGVTDADGNIAQVISGEALAGGNAVLTSHLSKEEVERNYQRVELLFGTNSNADKVPKALLEFYAYSSLYKEFTRDDFVMQFKEYTQGGKLKKLNKQISSALGLMQTAHQLSSDTRNKLEDYIRISLVASCVANTVKNDEDKAKMGSSPDEQAQIDLDSLGELKTHKKNMVNAILAVQYVRRALTKPNMTKEQKYQWADTEDENLFNWLIDNRQLGPMNPFSLSQNGMRYFSESQLAELKPLYPHLFWR